MIHEKDPAAAQKIKQKVFYYLLCHSDFSVYLLAYISALFPIRWFMSLSLSYWSPLPLSSASAIAQQGATQQFKFELEFFPITAHWWQCSAQGSLAVTPKALLNFVLGCEFLLYKISNMRWCFFVCFLMMLAVYQYMISICLEKRFHSWSLSNLKYNNYCN
jgi:hypothetical protein